MKYLKTYEVVVEKPENQEYSISDFVNKTYWRYKNSKIDCIMELRSYTASSRSSSFKYKILQNDKEFANIEFDSDMLRTIIHLEDSVKILRPATPEEIEHFKSMEEIIKYNL